MCTSTRKHKPNPNSYYQDSGNAMIEKFNAVLNPATGKMQEYRHLIKGNQAEVWAAANNKEIARLAQGRAYRSIEGTNTTLLFKHPKSIPLERRPTYLQVLATYRPTKENKHHLLWTVGGNYIDYPGVAYTPNT